VTDRLSSYLSHVFSLTISTLRIFTGVKAIPVTGRGGLQCYEILRTPHCLDLDSRLTDGGKVVSPTLWPLSTPQKHFLLLVLISVRG
jgi:hypothetical protein